MRRPTAHVPHLSGLYELDRLADDVVVLAEQIKQEVQRLRREEDGGKDDRDDTG